MDRLTHNYLPANYEDCFRQSLRQPERMFPRDLLQLLFVRYPQPILWLLIPRVFTVRLFHAIIVKSLMIKAIKI